MVRRIRPSALLLLPAILVPGFVAYLPHLNTAGQGYEGLPGLGQAYEDWLVDDREEYEFALHVDDHVHWVSVACIRAYDGLRCVNPLTWDSSSEFLSLRGLVHERGYHVALAQFLDVTGLAWPVINRFLPAAFAVLTAGLVYLALQPHPSAPLAAALTALIPTSARFLGPGFLVPSGQGLAFIAAALLLARLVVDQRRGSGLLLLLVPWTFFIHLFDGLVALVVVLAYLPFARGRGLGQLALAAALPALALLRFFLEGVENEIGRLSLPIDYSVFDQIGLPFLFAYALAVPVTIAALGARSDVPHGVRAAVGSATLTSVVIFVALVLNLVFHWRAYVIYDRAHQPWTLLAAVPIAFGTVVVAQTALSGVATLLGRGAALVRRALPLRDAGPANPGPARRAWTGPLSGAATAVLVAAMALPVLSAGVTGHLEEPYYQVMDRETWAAYVALAHEPPAHVSLFLSEPWQAPVLAALTGWRPVTYLSPGSPPIHGELYIEYLNARSGDAAWLVSNDVSLVADRFLPSAEHYTRIHGRAAELDEPYRGMLYDVLSPPQAPTAWPG